MGFVSVGARIRSARGDAGLTQEQLARAVGKTVMTISRYERGAIKEPSSIVLGEIAKATNVSVHWLVTGESETLVAPETPDPPFWQEFLEKYEHITQLAGADLNAMKTFAARTHRIRGWYDWAQLAEWIRNRRPSPTFEAVVAADKERDS